MKNGKIHVEHKDSGGEAWLSVSALNAVWRDKGWAPVGDDTPEDDAPAKNASREDWLAYAIAAGADPDEADELTRDELAKRYGS